MYDLPILKLFDFQFVNLLPIRRSFSDIPGMYRAFVTIVSFYLLMLLRVVLLMFLVFYLSFMYSLNEFICWDIHWTKITMLLSSPVK